jgi:hypothetical protein
VKERGTPTLGAEDRGMTTPIDNLTARLARLADNETDEARLLRTVEALRAAEEARKLTLEADNLRRTSRSENARFYVSVLAPLISAAVLAGTLIFQISDSRTEARANADAELSKSVAALGHPDPLQSTLAASQLQFLYGSEDYRNKARQMAIGLMRMVVRPELADSVFTPLLRDTRWPEINEVLSINRALLDKHNYVSDQLDGEDAAEAEMADPRRRPAGRSRLTEEDLDALYGQLRFVGGELSAYLRGTVAGPRPTDVELDLSGTAWFNVDLTGADLHGANLENAWLSSVDLEQADLSKIERVTGSFWYGKTSWWRARAISPALLAYLEEKLSCDTACADDKECRQTCATESVRLRSNPAEPPSTQPAQSE